MKYATVCSGIEAPSVAWHLLGWHPAFFSEIEKFPSAVLAHHYPTVPNLGDMTNFKEWPDATFDVFCGGTPCQSFSVAGLRKGLDDPRGSLMLTYLAIAARYRPRWLVWENVPGVLSINGGRDFGSFLGGLGVLGYGFAYRVLDAQYHRLAQRRRRVFVVGCAGDWRSAAAVLFERHSLSGHPAPRRETGQGIAGTLSARSEGGGGLRTDFECDVGVVAHSLRGEGFDASEDGTGRGIPLVPMAIQGTMINRGDTAGPMGSGISQDGLCFTLTKSDVPAVAFNPNAQSCQLPSASSDCSINHGLTCSQRAAVAFKSSHYTRGKDGAPDSVAPPLSADADKGDQDTLVLAAVGNSNYNQGFNLIGGCDASAKKECAVTLLSRVQKAIGEKAFAEWGFGILDSLQSSEILRSALHGGELRPARFSRNWVVYCALSREEDRGAGAMLSLREAVGDGCPSQGWESLEQCSRQLGAYLSELSQPGAQAEKFMRDLWGADEGSWLLRQTLSKIQKARRPVIDESKPAHGGMLVRRLTADECEFLQGFPRGYTLIPYNGNPAKDGPRYKALGNSMAVPVMRWIGERIAMVDSIKIPGKEQAA